MRIYLSACGGCSVLGALLLSACGSDTKPLSAGGAAGMSGSAGEAEIGGSQPSDSAQWPMPNSPSLGLPNPASYDADTTPGVVHDLVTGLDWLQDPGSETYSRADAISRCAELSFAGFDDWRIPTFIELVSLFDVVPNLADPVDPIYISPVFRAQGRYWASSALDTNGLGRLLDFTAAGCTSRCSIGVSGMPDSAVIGGAFCVRGSQPPATSARYQTSGEQVLDSQTGLTWQGVPAAIQTVDYDSAVSECDALGNGMRLPSITELLSILLPLLDKQAFPDWPNSAFAWSSSSIPAKPFSYWAGASGGATDAKLATSNNRVQCVR